MLAPIEETIHLRDGPAVSELSDSALRPQRVAGAEPIPGYRLIEFLGRGGFGDVWKCEAPGGLFKAIKFVNGNLKGLDTDCAAARQELEALERVKSIRHPFILSMDRVEVVGGELLIVMELADRSLLDRFAECQNSGQAGIPREELLSYMAEAAEALDVMNLRHGLLHLDVKPGNLFLISEHLKVADFGLVNRVSEPKAGDSRASLGGLTPVYSSPEAFLGRLSPQSDQYSLAIVYHELLTGVAPFLGTNARQLMMKHINEPPQLDRLAESDRAIVSRALAKKPDERFPSCLLFIQALMMGEASPPQAAAGPHTSRIVRSLSSRAPSPIARPSASRPQSGRSLPSARSKPSGTGNTPAVMRSAPTLPGPAAPAVVSNALPGYKFLTMVGQSLFGEVWQVEAPTGEQRFLRFLPNLPGSDPAAERAHLERLAALHHPLLPTHELHETDTGRLVLLSELFDQTVADRCRICQAQRQPGIPRNELLDYLWPVAEALDQLHEEEAIHHLSLTPRSLALSGDALLLTDVGLAELYGLDTDPRRLQIVARYAAPEVLEGESVEAGDQYSLALIYVEMLTGVHPFRGQSVQRMSKVRDRPNPSLQLLSGADQRVIALALSVNPTRRFPNCTALMRALESGDAEIAPALVTAKTPQVRDSKVSGTPLQKNFDFARAMEGLHRLLGTLGGDGFGGNSLQGRVKDSGLELVCGVRVYGPATRLKLEGFRQQWNGTVVRVDPDCIVYSIPLKGGFWQRLSKQQPSLEVSIRFTQALTVAAQLSQATIRIEPVQCSGDRAAELLRDVAPLLIESVRSYLQATPERREQDRLAFSENLTIHPVFVDSSEGESLECRGKDISLRGIGLIVPEQPPTNRLFVTLPVPGSEEPIHVPAEIVRVQRRADGMCELGARFAFGGFASLGRT